MKHIPEHWITDLFEFHFTFIRFKQNYGVDLSSQYKNGNNIVDNLITFMCVILCENEMISNPYSKAQILELVSYFGSRNDLIGEIYENNKLANVRDENFVEFLSINNFFSKIYFLIY